MLSVANSSVEVKIRHTIELSSGSLADHVQIKCCIYIIPGVTN